MRAATVAGYTPNIIPMPTVNIIEIAISRGSTETGMCSSMHPNHTTKSPAPTPTILPIREIAVSYTHLDVYKRQLYTGGLDLRRAIETAGEQTC